MKICYTDNSEPSRDFLDAIFLAGPTPRSPDVPSWRPEALRLLEFFGYDGTVFVPEWSDWSALSSYDNQVEWEYANLLHCRVIAFWVPRNMETMPALTTNVEFGFWLSRSPFRIVYGRPDDAVATRYLDWLYGRSAPLRPTCPTPCRTLAETMEKAVTLTKVQD